MHQIVITKFGAPNVMKWKELPSSPLKAGQARIRVRASGVNFADLQMRMGLYPEAPKPPFTPGYEIAGEILEVGAGVTQYNRGESVLAFTAFGGYADEIVLDTVNIQKMPTNVDFKSAASIPVNFSTAWVALKEMARVKKGDRVLVHSAAGGVGVAAVQLAKNAGAVVTGMTGTKSKEKFLRDLGCDQVVFSPPEVENQFDIVLDSTGGKVFKTSFESLAPMGRMVCFGVAGIVSGPKRSLITTAKTMLSLPWYNPIKLMTNNKGVYGLNMLALRTSPEVVTESLRNCLDEISKGNLRTYVGKTFTLKEAALAHEALQSRSVTGKVILTSD